MNRIETVIDLTIKGKSYRVVNVPTGCKAHDPDTNEKYEGPCICLVLPGTPRIWVRTKEAALEQAKRKRLPAAFVQAIRDSTKILGAALADGVAAPVGETAKASDAVEKDEKLKAGAAKSATT